MKFRPCIDLHQGKVKQIVGSTLSDTAPGNLITNFETDLSPEHFATLYKNDRLYGGHVIMLGADAGNKAAAVQAIHAFPQGLQVGGGITPDNAAGFLEQGASHVIVTSCIFKEGKIKWENLDVLKTTVGKQRLVLDLSCLQKGDDYFIATDRWQKLTKVTVSKGTLETLATYCDEFLIHAAHVEGLRKGIDRNLVTLLGNHCPIPVTYAGGVQSLDDLDLINMLGNGRVDATVGSALDIFGGDLPYADVVAWHKKHQTL
jgi:phosphoribosylformimino-5-aminoimidazole carboxamide ribotide isomerase